MNIQIFGKDVYKRQDVLSALRRQGFRKAVMLTGDSERTAAAIAAEVGVDEYHAEVLPEDKARYVLSLIHIFAVRWWKKAA